MSENRKTLTEATGARGASSGSKLSEHQLAELNELHQGLARDLGTTLSALTRRRVTAEVEVPKLMTIEEWEQETSSQARLALSLHIEPPGATMLLTLDEGATFGLLEALLGAGLGSAAGPSRGLTEIELAVLQTLHPAIVHELDRAWGRFGDSKFRVAHHGRSLRRSQLGAVGEKVIAVHMDIDIDQQLGLATLALPLTMAPADDGQEVAEDARANEQAKRAIFRRLKTSNLELDATIRGSTIRLGDLLGLQAGDIVRLDNVIKQPVEVHINGAPRFQGKFIAGQKRRSLMLEELTPPGKQPRPAA